MARLVLDVQCSILLGTRTSVPRAGKGWLRGAATLDVIDPVYLQLGPRCNIATCLLTYASTDQEYCNQ